MNSKVLNKSCAICAAPLYQVSNSEGSVVTCHNEDNHETNTDTTCHFCGKNSLIEHGDATFCLCQAK